MNRTAAILLIVVLATAATGYWLTRKPIPDIRPATDATVQGAIATTSKEDGIEFLESGGKYVDKDPSQAGLDQTIVLPLLREIAEKFGRRPLALVMEPEPDDDERLAGLMILELPDDEAELNQLKQFFLDADKAFPGIILHQYGHRWMHFDFLNEATAKSMEMENWEIQ